MDHERGDAVGEALGDHEVPGVGQSGLVEPGHVSQQVVEAVSRHPACGVHVDAVQPLHDLRVIGDLKLRHDRLSEGFPLYVGGIIRSDGHRRVDDIRDRQQDLVDFRLQLRLPGLQLRQPLGVGFHLRLDGLGLLQLGRVLFRLTHEHAHLFAEGVSLGPELAGLGNGSSVFSVQRQDLVYQGELLILEFLLDVFFYNIGVFADKLNIKQGRFLLLCRPLGGTVVVSQIGPGAVDFATATSSGRAKFDCA